MRLYSHSAKEWKTTTMAREILLNTGNAAIVDDEDYELVSRYNWTESDKGYAITSIKINGKWKTVPMHRLINNTPAGMLTDHIDGDRLNNRRENLRTCEAKQNMQNMKIFKSNKSGYKGVSVKKNISKQGNEYLYWMAQIKLDLDKPYKLFPYTEEGKLQAARWYDEQARLHFGEFAKVNGV